MKTYTSRAVIGALIAVTLSIPAAHAEPSARPAEPSQGITLVTGDKVILGGAGGATVRLAKGRERIQFLTQRDTRGDMHVTPVDALSGVRSGQFDPRLFNVSQLIKHGFGDAGVARDSDDRPGFGWAQHQGGCVAFIDAFRLK